MATVIEQERKTIYTVRDAAEQFGRTTARIRQICIKHEIGTLIEGRVRILKAKDIRKIGRFIEKSEKS